MAPQVALYQHTFDIWPPILTQYEHLWVSVPLCYGTMCPIGMYLRLYGPHIRVSFLYDTICAYLALFYAKLAHILKFTSHWIPGLYKFVVSQTPSEVSSPNFKSAISLDLHRFMRRNTHRWIRYKILHRTGLFWTPLADAGP